MTTSDAAFLRAMVADPRSDLPRLVYADYLEESGDTRAALLRTDWAVPRLVFLDWNRVSGDEETLREYLDGSPELRAQLPEREANIRWRELVAGLEPPADPAWLAAVDVLGRPFAPFHFWNNTGPRAFEDGELPFTEMIGTRGRLLTFDSAFRGADSFEPGLLSDVAFLCGLTLDGCEYGSASCPSHPFACELPPGGGPLTGRDVVAALKAREFRSRFIPDLDATMIAYPGYHADRDNDEVHTDPAGQCLFPSPEDVATYRAGFDPDDEWDTESPALFARDATHERLRAAVAGGVLWYVLLHSRLGLPADGPRARTWVVLFAVGRSLRGDRLIGVVSHQLCHNLCN